MTHKENSEYTGSFLVFNSGVIFEEVERIRESLPPNFRIRMLGDTDSVLVRITMFTTKNKQPVSDDASGKTMRSMNIQLKFDGFVKCEGWVVREQIHHGLAELFYKGLKEDMPTYAKTPAEPTTEPKELLSGYREY